MKKKKKRKKRKKGEEETTKGNTIRILCAGNTMVTTPQSKLLALLLRRGVPAPSRALPEHCPETASSAPQPASRHHIGSVFCDEPLPRKGLLPEFKEAQGSGFGMGVARPNS